MSTPSVRALKETAPSEAAHAINPQQTDLLQDIFASKGIHPQAVMALATHEVIGRVLDTYFLGNNGAHDYPERKNGKKARKHLTRMALIAAEQATEGEGAYTGTNEENAAIIQGSYQMFDQHGRLRGGLRAARRNGASRMFRSGLVAVSKADQALGTSFTPIAIVGGGPSGILAGRALRASGFRNVTVFDRSGKAGGIWNNPDASRGTKNNPFTISYDSNHMNPPGRDGNTGMHGLDWDGIEGSGRDISMFVNSIRYGTDYSTLRERPQLRIVEGAVQAIEPGDLHHTLTIESKGRTEERTFPIVIAGIGASQPLPVSDPARMETPNSDQDAGQRWQEQLSQEELHELARQSIVLVSLGNSTAEMLYQFQKFEDKMGVNIDYKVLTHYPNESLQSPRRAVDGFEPLFRDLSKPNLVKLAGDLKHVEALYWRAMQQGKIISDVTRWSREGGQCNITLRDGTESQLPADKLYTLVGYRPSQKTLDRMGIHVTDERLGTGAYDFDGEVQRLPGETGRDRVYPGFFAVGAMVKSPFNPNAMVIPGIQYQLSDLLTTVSLRAAEHALKPESQREINAAKRAYYAHIVMRQAAILKESFAAPAAGRSPGPVPARY